jgi:hypothetical protein
LPDRVGPASERRAPARSSNHQRRRQGALEPPGTAWSLAMPIQSPRGGSPCSCTCRRPAAPVVPGRGWLACRGELQTTLNSPTVGIGCVSPREVATHASYMSASGSLHGYVGAPEQGCRSAHRRSSRMQLHLTCRSGPHLWNISRS